MDFDESVQIVIMYSAFVKYLRKKNGNIMVQNISYLDFKESYNSVRGKVLYNILSLVYA